MRAISLPIRVTPFWEERAAPRLSYARPTDCRTCQFEAGLGFNRGANVRPGRQGEGLGRRTVSKAGSEVPEHGSSDWRSAHFVTEMVVC